MGLFCVVLLAYSDDTVNVGTVTVIIDHEGFEVTTYRIDGEYIDGRHPESVVFTGRLTDDLGRRDFTINAMAYSQRTSLVDEFGGIEDLRSGVIRCVGDADTRFNEDALRMMRALRFSAELDFDIDESTYDSIKRNNKLLSRISRERIYSEFVKLLVSDHPDKLREVYETGLCEDFIPELSDVMNCTQNNPHHIYTVGEHTLRVIYGVRKDPVMRLAALFHDFGKPVCKTTDENGTDHFHGHPFVSSEIAKRVLKRLKSDNETIERVKILVENHDMRTVPEKNKVRRLIAAVGKDNISDLFELQRADVMAQSEYNREDKLRRIDMVSSIAKEVIEGGEALTIRELAISGRDLMELGVRSGPGMGKMLNCLLEAVLDDPGKNDRETLLTLSGEMINEKN